MPKNVAPPKSTGGGGFVFEDQVCAWFIAHMLADEPALDASTGCIDRIYFQARPDGWFLDDIVLELCVGADRHRVALSIKSNTQFTDAGAPDDFVRAAWEQFLGESASAFVKASDFMGLITTPLPTETREALEFVVRTAKDTEAHLLPGRYAQNNGMRTVFTFLLSGFRK